jgi:hypothetical protein
MENVLSAAQKKRKEQEKRFLENCVIHARNHATAVAAIFLSGSPSVNEPLNKAWARALQHYNVSFSIVSRSLRDQILSAQRLFPMIMEGKPEITRFTEIFRTVPHWLMTFTSLIFDRNFLKFSLPQAPEEVLKWGTIGYEQSCEWPLLPSGTMADGDPVSNEKAKLWPFSLNISEQAKPIFDIEKNRPQEEEVSYSPEEAEEIEFLNNVELFLESTRNPQGARGLPRHQRLRLHAFVMEQLSKNFSETSQVFRF